MNTSSDNRITQPNIIQALLSGFNTIANKPYLMLLPVLLDLFLWFGPTWRVDQYFYPFLQSILSLPGLENPEYTQLLEELRRTWETILVNFDLAVTLRTIPIGVPSLLASKSPFSNPLGNPLIFTPKTDSQILGLLLIFLITGYILGSLYFRNISNQIIKPINNESLKTFLRTFAQIILMPIMIMVIFLIIGIPIVFIFSLISVLFPGISSFMVILFGMLVFWNLIPLIFTPHGIFLYKLNLFPAMMTSIHVVRVSMGRTAWFLLASVILIQGLNYLWQTPPADNWFLIIGIFGHAFIVSAVIAASFHYFIDATKFSQSLLSQKIKSA
jgi:hypothetical protein